MFWYSPVTWKPVQSYFTYSKPRWPYGLESCDSLVWLNSPAAWEEILEVVQTQPISKVFFGPRASWDGLFTFCRALCTKMQRNFLVSRYYPRKLERLSLNCVQGKTRLTTTQQGWMSLAAINYHQSFIHRSVWEAFRGSIPQSLCKFLLIWHKKTRVISLCLEWAGRTWIKPHSQESMCLFWRTRYFLLVQFNHSFPSRSLYYFWEEIDWWRGSLLLTYFTEETRISGYCMLANHFWI